MPVVIPRELTQSTTSVTARGREISLVDDVPDGAYDDQNTATIAIAASLGGVALIAVVTFLVLGILRRRKRIANGDFSEYETESEDEGEAEEAQDVAAPAPPPKQQRAPHRGGFRFGYRRGPRGEQSDRRGPSRPSSVSVPEATALRVPRGDAVR